MARLFFPLLFGLLLAFPAGAQVTGAGALGAKAGEADSTEVSTNGDDAIFIETLEVPQFPGGEQEMMRFINQTVRYPVLTWDANIEGRVAVGFTVSEDGSVRDIYVVKSLHPYFDEEAVRVVKAMPRWIPAKDRGVNIAMKYVVPVTFRIPQ